MARLGGSLLLVLLSSWHPLAERALRSTGTWEDGDRLVLVAISQRLQIAKLDGRGLLLDDGGRFGQPRRAGNSPWR
jgi:hypothetical protein